MNKLLLFFVMGVVMFSCKKSSTNNTNNTDFFTPVYVNITVNTSFPQYQALNMQQGYVYETGGNRGVVIYHTIDDNFVAFDRTCPVDPTKDCSVVSVDSSSISFYKCAHFSNSGVTCTSGSFCNSKFDAAYGNPVTGPATEKQALRQYYVKKETNGTFYTLHITSTPQ